MWDTGIKNSVVTESHRHLVFHRLLNITMTSRTTNKNAIKTIGTDRKLLQYVEQQVILNMDTEEQNSNCGKRYRVEWANGFMT